MDGGSAGNAGAVAGLTRDNGDFFKCGHGGQGLCISPFRDLVIAMFCTWMESQDDQVEAGEVSRQLASSELFD